MKFSELATIAPDGKKLLNIRIYKYLKPGIGRVLGLKDGGSSSIADFITNYRKDTERFEAPGHKKPVIIVYDNDKRRESDSRQYNGRRSVRGRD